MPLGFNEAVHLVEQLGDSLDLVDDDPAVVLAGNERPQVRRIGGQWKVEIRAEQIDEERFGQLLSVPGGLTRSAGAE